MTKADIVNQVSKNTGIEKLVVQKLLKHYGNYKMALKVAKCYLWFGSFIVKKGRKQLVIFQNKQLLLFRALYPGI